MYNYKNKVGNVKTLNNYMFSRTLSMFEYEGLPETLPRVEIEKQLQQNGYTFITEIEGDLYALQGGLGGEPTPYNEPSKITISNPALKFNETLDINNDGVLIKNDDMMMGLYPLFEKYNTLLIENEITMFLNSFNNRIQQLISAGDDPTRESGELYLKKIVEGELGIIGENRLFDGIKAQNTSNSNNNLTTQLIEFNQYLKATLYNEVGLNANYNMKRERLNTSETEMNSDNLHPLVDNMMLNRKQGIQKLNEMYGLESSVQFGSIWEIRNIQDKRVLEDEQPNNEPTITLDEPNIRTDEPITNKEETEPETIEDDEQIPEPDDPTIEGTEQGHEINDIIDEQIPEPDDPTIEDDEQIPEPDDPTIEDDEEGEEDSI